MRPVTRAACAAFPFLLVVLLCGFSAQTPQRLGRPDPRHRRARVRAARSACMEPTGFPKARNCCWCATASPSRWSPDFAATADANVSFDAKTVLFSGKKAAGDPWQIWELTLADHAVRQVTAGAADVGAAASIFLAGAWSLRGARRHGFQLVAAGLDGKNELPLTYMPASALPADVLADGRILFEAGFPLGSGTTPELFLVYSDGSGVESYRCDHGVARWGGHQLASGDVVFTHGASLARFTSPLAHEAPVAAPRADYAGAIAEMPSGAWLVSTRASAAAAVCTEAVEAIAASPALTTILARPAENLVEPVLLAPRERPRQHPSALHDWNYANLLALDARLSRDANSEDDARAGPAGNAGCLRPANVHGHGSGRKRWLLLREGSRRPAHSFRSARRQGRSDAPGAWLVLDPPRRAAHLRRLPHRPGARRRKTTCPPCCFAPPRPPTSPAHPGRTLRGKQRREAADDECTLSLLF